MRKPSYRASDSREMPLEGFDVFSSAGRDDTSKIAPQSHTKLSIVYGVCCKCKDHPATLKSSSGNPESIYCSECGRSRCGVHTITDFELEESSGLWLDPCAIEHNWQQQSLIEK